MHTVKSRVYGVDKEGRKVLLHRPGDVIDDNQARRDPPADETPIKPLDRMKLDELRTICEIENIDPDRANTRADYIKVISRQRKATT